VITSVLSGVLVVLGLAVIVRTLDAGVGGGLGILFGAMLVLVGGLRLYLQRRGG
jgi:hypothetical protein